MVIKDMLMRENLALTPSEEKIVRLLLTDYPTSGLGTATNLARRADVSDPTVVRLVMKLGFDGYGDFQNKLLTEVEKRLHSPLLMMEAKRINGANDGIIASYLRSVLAAMEKSASTTPPQTYDRATKFIINAKGQVYLLGGRFSRHIAGMFGGYLTQFRSGVRDIGPLSSSTFDALADFGKGDILIVFDYRRYQYDVVAFAQQAARRKVRVLLFTDPWLSPIAEFADATIVSPLEVSSPYDTLSPAVAQMEALTAHIISSMNDEARTRIEALEEVRQENAVTLDTIKKSKNTSPKTSFGPKKRK